MKHNRFTRRDINKMGMAAFGGLVAGSVTGCGGGQQEGAQPESSPAAETDETAAPSDGATSDAAPADDADAMASAEKHLCRGLNSCKNQGASGENACAGQGTCASYTEHLCSEQNECKGQGGCGDHPGENDCKGEGHCGIPLMRSSWKIVRARLEKEMEAKGMPVGPAPAKPM